MIGPFEMLQQRYTEILNVIFCIDKKHPDYKELMQIKTQYYAAIMVLKKEKNLLKKKR